MVNGQFKKRLLVKINSGCQFLRTGVYFARVFCIWYNTQLSGEALFFPKWYNKGISLIGDIVESTGDIMTLQKIEKTFGFKINFLEYQSKDPSK